MIKKLWTKRQLPEIKNLLKGYRILSCVLEEMEKVINILDRYYGEECNVDEDDGGYILLILSDSNEEIRGKYLEEFLY